MELNNLEILLSEKAGKLKAEDKLFLEARLVSLISVFPFNKYEYMITFLVSKHLLSFDQYERLRQLYISENRYLDLYGLAPRIFGQIWGEQHLSDVDPRFKKPDKSLDQDFSGEYDLWIEGIKVEVKACRAIDTKQKGDLVSKALKFKSNRPFWMNYQQLKFDVADVFVFIGVWVDEIRYWILSNNEAKNIPYLSHQHRGGIEYQIGITEKNIHYFDGYLVKPSELGEIIIQKGLKKPNRV